MIDKDPHRRGQPPQLPPVVIPIHTFENYRDYLLYLIEVRKEVKGIRSRLAEAASCQPSYLTQVLAGTASFSIDQLRGISRYLSHSDPEWDYLRELGIMERAASHELREDCRRRLRQMREQASGADRQGASAQPAGQGPTPEDLSWYTSNWLAMLVNTAVQSKALRTPQAIARKAGLPAAQVIEAMKELEGRGFVVNKGGEWRTTTEDNMYLGRAGYSLAFRTTWFLRGQALKGQGYKGGSQIGAVFCLTRAEYDELRTRLTAEFRRFFSSLPPETAGDVIAYYGIDLFEA